MRSPNFSDDLLREHRDSIRADAVRAAFDVLSEHAQSLPGYHCEPRSKGVVRDFRYYTEDGREQPFAFIVNQGSLLFYIRLPGLERLRGGRVALDSACGGVTENKRGELQVRLQSSADATALIQHLFGENTPVGALPHGHTVPALKSTAIESAAPQTTAGELTDVFEWAVKEIEKAYVRLGHRIGWRFLMGPRATLSMSTQIALVSLNPGGTFEPPEHPRASSERGNSYRIESWPGHAPGRHALQVQVQALFEQLRVKLGLNLSPSAFLDQHVLAAPFIPFRSPRFEDLPNQADSLAFAQALWAKILDRWLPRLLVTIDRKAFDGLCGILDAKPGARVVERKVFRTGWGDYTCDTVRYSGLRQDAEVTLARLPHLSTFKVFSRVECRPYMLAFVEYIAG